MDTNAFTAIMAVVPAQYAIYVPALFGVCAVLAAVLPVPAAGSPWVPVRKLLDLLALNVGAAKNAPKSEPLSDPAVTETIKGA